MRAPTHPRLSLLHPGLGRRLLLWFLAVSLIPLTVSIALTYLNAYRSLRTSVLNSLAVVTELKTVYIHSYFDRVLADLREQSESTANMSFLEALKRV